MKRDTEVVNCPCGGNRPGHSALPTEGRFPQCLVDHSNRGAQRPWSDAKKATAKKQRAHAQAIAKAERAVLEAANDEVGEGRFEATDEDGCVYERRPTPLEAAVVALRKLKAQRQR